MGVSARFTADAGNTFMATDPSGDVRSNVIAFADQAKGQPKSLRSGHVPVFGDIYL